MTRSAALAAVLIAAGGSSSVVSGASAAEAATPRRILCLSDSPQDDSWAAELENQLNGEPGRAPYVVIRRAFTDGDERLLDDLLESYAPAFVVSRQNLSKRLSQEIVARGFPLLREQASSAKAAARADRTAKRIEAEFGERPPQSDVSRTDRLAFARARARAHLDFSEDLAAAVAFQNVLVLAPDDPEALLALIQLHGRASPWVALASADILAGLPERTDEQRADALLVSASLRSRVGDSAAAARDYESALRLRSNSPEGLLGLAQGRRSRPHEALFYAERAAARAPKRAEAHRVVAEIQLDLENASAAQTSLQRALRLAPDDLDSLALMVRAQRGQPTAAASYALRALALAEKTPLWYRHDAYRLCARMWLEIGDFARAALLYNRALALDPLDLNALNDLARLRRDYAKEKIEFVSGNSERELSLEDMSEDAALRVLADAPNNLEALRQLLAIRRDQGRLLEFSALAKRFIQAIPSAPRWVHASAYRLLSRLAWEAGDPARAWLAARERDPWALEEVRLRLRPAGGALDHSAFEVEAAEVRAELGDEKGAASLLGQLLALFPEDHHALQVLIQLKTSRSKFAEAFPLAERLERATAHSEPWVRALSSLETAKIQLELKDDDGAEKSLRKSLRFAETGGALSRLRDLASRRGRLEEALSFAERLEVVSANDPPRARGLRLVQMAQLQLRLNDEAGTEKSLRESMRLVETAAAASMLRELLSKQGRHAEAYAVIGRLETLVENDSPQERAQVLEQKAQVQYELKDESGAKMSLQESLRFVETIGALSLLRELVSKQGRFVEALSLIERIEAISGKASPREQAELLKQKAQIQLRLKREAGAEKSLRAALSLVETADALRLLRELTSKQERHDEALVLLGRLEALGEQASPHERAQILERKAQTQLELKDEVGAEKSLRDALSLSTEGPAMPLLLDLLMTQRRFAEALPYAEKIEAMSARMPAAERAAALARKAQIQLELRDVAGAEKSLTKSLSLASDGPALPALVSLRTTQRRFAEALSFAGIIEKMSLSQSPQTRAAAYAQKALIQLELKDEAGAEKSLSQSLSLNAEGGAAFPMMLNLMMTQRRFSEALSYAEKIEKSGTLSSPQMRARAYAQKAQIQLELKDGHGAQKSLLQALALAPDDMDVLWMLFDIKRSNPGEALRFVVAHRPSAVKAEAVWLALRGHARVRNGESDGAREDFAVAVKMDPEGVCFGPVFDKRRGGLDSRYFDLCLERFPASASLHSDRGVSRYLADRSDDALIDFRKAIELEPAYLPAHMNLLSILSGQKRTGEALAAADAAVFSATDRGAPLFRQILEIQASIRRTAASLH